MLLRTPSFLLLASLLLCVVNGRRLADQRTSNVIAVDDVVVVTQPVLLEVEEKHQTRRRISEEEEPQQKKAGNDDDLEGVGHDIETATHSPDNAFNISATTVISGIVEEAAPLDVFRNIDPTKFKWVNPDNIEPGATTCGFLHTTLGAEPGVNYPIIRVYICMKFAMNQPAPSGSIVVHCGGPATLSSCINNMGTAYAIGEENAHNYNIIGIDQRGMGRSWPSFYHEECNDIDFASLDDDGKYNASGIQEFLDRKKNYVKRCWACTDCDYQFNIEQADGNVRSFHFLEYSGTRQLAEDLDRFRVLIEAPSLTLYGLSYGTTVMSTYATIFPNNVDKFILDGSVTPYNTAEPMSRSMAVGFQLRYKYLKYTCWAARLKNPDSCPVEPDDIANCAKKSGYLMDLITNSDSFTDEELNGLPISISDIPDIVTELSTKAIKPIDFLLLLITEDPITMGKICSTDDAEWDWDTLNELLKISQPNKRGIGLGIDCDSYDQPSNEHDGICFDYKLSDGDMAAMVRGQDYAGGVSAYDDNVYINHILTFQDEYGWEYNDPLAEYAIDLAYSYYLPKNVPLPILGNPLVDGIIAGQLYDSATPYIWTSQMREHFPSTSLLTSQSIFHGLHRSTLNGFTNVDTPAEDICQKYLVKYLETGLIDWTDGTVCGEQFPYFDGEIRK